MTLQQLKYIIAVNRHRSFSKAADSCGISQSTLSAMLVKLEEELDTRIFDRSNKRVSPTAIGVKIIRQAERAIAQVERINMLVNEKKNLLAGNLSLSVDTTITPYILPKFIRHYMEEFPQVNLNIREMNSEAMLDELLLGHIDVGMAIGGNVRQGLLEIPLYSERFVVYLAEQCWRKLPVFKPENLEHEKMWVMKQGQCIPNSAFNICKSLSKGRRIYETGSIETLIRIVDENGGFTIIPEMHIVFLDSHRKENIRRIEGDMLPQRHVSLYIREDYIQQGILNTITKTLLCFMPNEMIDERIIKYGVKL